MTPEGRVKEIVKRALKPLTGYRFAPVQNGMGAPSLDLLYCFSGLFVAIETKVPGKALTPRQQITASAIRDAGGKVFVIRDEHDCVFMVRKIAEETSCGHSSTGLIYDTLSPGPIGEWSCIAKAACQGIKGTQEPNSTRTRRRTKPIS